MIDTVIYTDCDGCLLDWNTPFNNLMKSKGLFLVDKTAYNLEKRYNTNRSKIKECINEFCNSKEYANLKPFPGAINAVQKAYKKGFKFHVITASDNVSKKRTFNLYNVFGKEVFTKIDYTGWGGCKKDLLQKLRKKELVQYWIEDKIKNAYQGLDLGFKSFLIDHSYNHGESYTGITRLKNFEYLYCFLPDKL